MDVRISYGIDLNDLPNKVKQLLETCVDQTQELAELCSLSSQLIRDDISYLKTSAKTIEEARLALASIDKKINDVAMILGGFINFVENPPQPTEEEDAG